jgi:hypothetical protein
VPEGLLLPRMAAAEEPVVQVFKEPNNTLEYARRYSTATVALPVFDREVSYRVVLSNPATSIEKNLTISEPNRCASQALPSRVAICSLPLGLCKDSAFPLFYVPTAYI